MARRLRSVVSRYPLSSGPAKERVRLCMRTLAPYGLMPTFATPGRVVEADPAFFREISQAGVELAFHGYDHVDFRTLARAPAQWQFKRALAVYEQHGIPCDGFRCPYLSYTPELDAALPDGVFVYGSNRAVKWPVVSLDAANPVFGQLATFYGAVEAEQAVCVPSSGSAFVELPASIPDDLQLFDALQAGEEGVYRAWSEILGRAHRGRELFAPLFHPESFGLMAGAVDDLLRDAKALEPRVWFAQLRDVARWWREKAGFVARWTEEEGVLRIELDCTDRATVLVREWPEGNGLQRWDDTWSVLPRRLTSVDGSLRPFVGAAGLDDGTVAFLRDQGYVVVDQGDEARRCTVVLDEPTVRAHDGPRGLVEHIETSGGPLVKFSRWPSATGSALCFAGDLDALSLRDYLARPVRALARRRAGAGS